MDAFPVPDLRAGLPPYVAALQEEMNGFLLMDLFRVVDGIDLPPIANLLGEWIIRCIKEIEMSAGKCKAAFVVEGPIDVEESLLV